MQDAQRPPKPDDGRNFSQCGFDDHTDFGNGPAAASLARLRAASAARPFVVAQLGQSLDGRIATPSGESRYISGPAALDHLHLLRAHVDAVVVGAGTVAADDPQLTVRRTGGFNPTLAARQPARVVLDPQARLCGDKRWLADDGARKILITQGARADYGGCEHIIVTANEGGMDPHTIVKALFDLGLRRLLIEGGANTISRFIDARALDRLHLMIACTIIGSGRMGLTLKPLNRLCDAVRPKTDVFALGGGDILFDCDMRATFLDNKGDENDRRAIT